MEATVTSLLCCANQALNFRDMFILGRTVEVYMQGSQIVFADCKLAICKNLGQPGIAFPVELVQRLNRGYNNVSIHGRENTGCVVVDVSGCCD